LSSHFVAPLQKVTADIKVQAGVVLCKISIDAPDQDASWFLQTGGINLIVSKVR
jgi:hypothetical protein